jgi:two-component system, sensor histidine kinase and response regulator
MTAKVRWRQLGPKPRRGAGQASLSQRLVLLLLAVGLTPLVLSQLVTLRAFLNQERHHLFSVVEQLASTKADEAQGLMTGTGIQLDQLVQESQGQPERLRRAWRQRAAQLGLSDLLLVDRTSQRVVDAALHPELVGLELGSERLRSSGLSQAVLQLSAWNQVSKAPLAPDPSLGGVAAWLAVPLQNAQGSPLVLVGRLEATAFQEKAFMRKQGVGHGFSVQLVTLRSEGGQLQLTPLDSSPDSAGAAALTTQPARWLGAGAPNLRGDGGSAYLVTAEGKELLAAWRRMPFSPVAVLVTMPQDVARRDSQELTATILAILLVTAALVALVGVVLGRRLVRPLRDLHRAVQDFDPGEATSLHPVAVRGHDEIASLAGTINAMASRIQERTAKLRSTKDQLDTYIQTVQTTLLALDLRGCVTLLNRSGRNLLGSAEGEEDPTWPGEDWIQHWVAEADRPRVRHWLLQAAAGQLPPAGQLDYAVRTRSRGERLFHWHLSLLEGPDGEVTGLLSSGEDITDRQAQAAALEQARRDAELANAAKSDFLSRMSHELRTPMNAIIGMTHLALRTDLDRRQRDYLQKISGAGQNLLEIINDILDFSKIEAGKLQLEQADFQLDSVLADVANLVADRVFANGVELLFSVEDEVPSSLNGDPLRLTQVLLNLLSNAAKFTERGEIILRVSRLEQRQHQVVLQFAVQDTGIGMSPEQTSRLFQMFSQAESSTTRRYGGTGLGLSICQRLLTLMGGSIRVDSRLGEGSCFTAVVPFARGQDGPNRVLPAALNGLRVLVVDDNLLAREVMQGLLAPMHLRCDLVAGGEEALARVRSAGQDGDPYGLLLLDWRLGVGLDGLAVAQRVRSDPQLPQPRIVMVTAFGFEEALQQAPPGLLDASLSKPVCPSELVDTLANLFGVSATAPGLQSQPAGDHHRALAVEADFWRLQGLRVLVVEDNLINQQIVEELLQIAGVVVSKAANGVEALAWLEARSEGAASSPSRGEPQLPCDLVLLDLNMPEMDGWECAQRIRSDPRWCHLPLLAMTAHAMQQERDRCLALGMQDHITKPIDPQLLYGRLQHWGGRPAPVATDGEVSGPGPGKANGTSTLVPPQGPIAELVERLPGFDVARALKRVGGNVDLYRRLLGSLVHTQADADLRLAEALAKPDLRQAEHIAHTVKGVAANLGGLALTEAASHLDGELKQGRAPAGLQQRFVDALQHTLAEITAALIASPNPQTPIPDGEDGEPHAPLPPARQPLSPTQMALIERLDALLALADGESLELVEQERPALEAVLGSAGLACLEAALQGFDFSSARDLLKPSSQQGATVTPTPCLPR